MADTEAGGLKLHPPTPEQGFRNVRFGGKGVTGQDVSIILVPSGTKDHKLACISLHSGVLSTHSKYFDTCLSVRWNGAASQCTSSPVELEFVLEAQAGIQSYIDCFSSMYSPLTSFEGVEQALEILKVASQIDFQELMKRISLYLSCKCWCKEDEVRIREYAASPDFPRIHLEGLVAKLGMDESKEQLCDGIRECTRAVFKECCEKRKSFPVFLEGIGGGPSSEFSRMVIGVVTDEAKKIFVSVANKWNGKEFERHSDPFIFRKVHAMSWILESLLNEGVAEELVRSIVHLEGMSNLGHLYSSGLSELSGVVLKMYKEVTTLVADITRAICIACKLAFSVFGF